MPFGPVKSFDPLGAHFVSYRQSDGTPLATEIEWRLRAAGVPVWRDVRDLLPGDTKTRIQEALGEGLAGGVLVITPEVEKSEIVREIEAPELIDLAERTEFSLAIANNIRAASGGTDYRAPDRLLGRPDDRLSGFLQYGIDKPQEMRNLVDGVRQLRMRNLRERVAANDGWLHVSVQTRNHGSTYDRSGAELDLRLQPAEEGRLPGPLGLRFFVDAAPKLPNAVTVAGTRSVRLSGGAHPSVAIALGALLPATRVGVMEVLDNYGGEPWVGASPDFSTADALAVVEQTTGVDDARSIALFLDLISDRSDAAWDAFLRDGPAMAATAHVRAAHEGMLRPEDASRYANHAASLARALSSRHGGAEVHLFYRGPFALAPLIGRHLNTLTTVLYEWDDGGGEHRYVPALRCRPADQGNPISVLMAA